MEERYLKGLSLILLALLICSPSPLLAASTKSPPIHTLNFSISFNPPSIKAYGDYHKIEMSNVKFLSIPGYPSLPVKIVTIKLNARCEIINVNVMVDSVNLRGNYRIIPAPQPQPLDGGGRSYRSTLSSIYNSSSPYPGSWVEYKIRRGLDPATFERVSYLTLYIYPLRYIPVEGRLVFAKRVNVQVTYSDEEARSLNQNDGLDLLVITSPLLQNYANTLAVWKNDTGIRTRVVTTDWIYATYPGIDEPEKIRNCIKDFYGSYGIKFVLIFGDADQVPTRSAYIPDGYEDDDESGDGSLVETDLYYADLDGTWNDNGDDKWGDLEGGDIIDALPDVLIGRLPASTEDEAQALIDKVMSYKPKNSWFMSYLLLGTDPFSDEDNVPEGEYLKNYIHSNFIWNNFTVVKLYETSGNLTVSNTFNEIEGGYGLINFAGHGDQLSWNLGTGERYTYSHASSQSNSNLSVIFAMACLTSRFKDYDCIGEHFLLNPSGGAIAYLGASRVTWAYSGADVVSGLAGELDWRFVKTFFETLSESSPEEPYLGVVWGKTIIEYVQNNSIDTYYENSGYLDWKIVAEYGTPFGDPSLLLKGEPEKYKVYGYVKDRKGNPISGALVEVRDNFTGYVLKSSSSNIDGYYEIDDLNPGIVYLTVSKEGYQRYTSDPFTLSSNIEVNVTLTLKGSIAIWPKFGIRSDKVYNVFYVTGNNFEEDQPLYYFLKSYGLNTPYGNVSLGCPYVSSPKTQFSLPAKTNSSGGIPDYCFVIINGSDLIDVDDEIGIATSPFPSEAALDDISTVSLNEAPKITQVEFLSFVFNESTNYPHLTNYNEVYALKYGDEIKIKGENFTPNGIVKLFWNSPDNLIEVVQANEKGEIDVSMSVPNGPSGFQALLVYDESKDVLALNLKDNSTLNYCNWITLLIKPSLEFNVKAINGTSNRAFDIIGHNFMLLNPNGSPNSPVDLAYSSGIVEKNSTILNTVYGTISIFHDQAIADSTGVLLINNVRLAEDIDLSQLINGEDWWVEVVVPWSVLSSEGIISPSQIIDGMSETVSGYLLISTPNDIGDEYAGYGFNETSKDVITRKYGAAGESFKALIWNFPANVNVNVTFDSEYIGSIVTDDVGYGEGLFTVPERLGGIYKVSFECGDIEVNLTYIIPGLMSVNVSGEYVPSGSWITLCASNLNPDQVFVPKENNVPIIANTDYRLIAGSIEDLISGSIRPNGTGYIVLEYKAFYDPFIYGTGSKVMVSLGCMEDYYLSLGALNRSILPLLTLKEVPISSPKSILGARDGSIWISNGTCIVKVDRRGNIQKVKAQAILLAEGRGTVWYAYGDKLGCIYAKTLTKIGEFKAPSEIIDLTVDRRGNAWFTYSQGYGKASTSGIELICTLPSTPKGIAVDRRGNTWIALPGENKLFYRDFRTGENRTIDVECPPEWVAVDRRGNVWFTSGDKLIIYDGSAFTSYDLEIGLDKFVVDGRRRAWVITENGIAYCLSKGVFENFPIGKPSSITLDRRGNVWLCLNGEIVSFPTKRGLLIKYEVRGLNITSICANENVIWSFDYQHNILVKISNEHMEVRDDLPAKGRNMAIDRRGVIWISSPDSLIKFKDGVFELVDTNSFVFNVFVDRRGNIWFSEPYNSSIAQLDRRGRLIRYYLNDGSSPFLLAVDRRGNVWFTSGDGIKEFSPRYRAVIEEYRIDGSPSSIAVDRKGVVWFTLNGKLYRISDGSVKPFTLYNFNAHYVFTDRRGNVWFSDLENGYVVKVGRRGTEVYIMEGMPYVISMDRRGNVYIGAQNGFLYVINYRESVIKNKIARIR